MVPKKPMSNEKTAARRAMMEASFFSLLRIFQELSSPAKNIRAMRARSPSL